MNINLVSLYNHELFDICNKKMLCFGREFVFAEELLYLGIFLQSNKVKICKNEYIICNHL